MYMHGKQACAKQLRQHQKLSDLGTSTLGRSSWDNPVATLGGQPANSENRSSSPTQPIQLGLLTSSGHPGPRNP
eukprot:1141880-Pelagomonas_calceolata.AAC.2